MVWYGAPGVLGLCSLGIIFFSLIMYSKFSSFLKNKAKQQLKDVGEKSIGSLCQGLAFVLDQQLGNPVWAVLEQAYDGCFRRPLDVNVVDVHNGCANFNANLRRIPASLHRHNDVTGVRTFGGVKRQPEIQS